MRQLNNSLFEKNVIGHLCLLLIALVMSSASFAVQASDLLKPCRVDEFAQQVQCGQIQRALNPGEPKGKQIAVHFIVLRAQDNNKAPDPIFLLAGGPGQSAINVASWMQILFEKLQRRHDLVFVDQRGTGKSAPLECQTNSDLKGIGDRAYAIKEALTCKATLEKLPYGDLRYFTTTLAMQDLDAVRQELNYPQINLIGISYGTRAALEYARLYPDRVRRSILDGVVQADQMLAEDDLQKSLSNVFNACAQDKQCKKTFPNLRMDWSTLLSKLPQTTALIHPRLGTKITATITRDDVLGWVSSILYSPVNSAALPNAIEQALVGNFNPFVALSGVGNLPNQGSIAYGMHFSVVCAEEYEHMLKTPKAAPDNDFGNTHQELYLEVCRQWPRGKVADDFYRTPMSKAPVLLLSGGLDPVTPPWHAEQVAKALGPMARQLVLANSGHGMLQQSCLSDVATQFINAKTDKEALEVEASCMVQIPRPSVWIAPMAATKKSAEK